MRPLTLALAVLLAGCVPGGGGDPPIFPIIGNDPGDLVETMEWGESPAPGSGLAGESPLHEVLATSTPEVLRIAVAGGQCPPSAQVQVTGEPDAVVVAMILGGSIAPPDEECDDVATTHELIITFRQPIDLAAVQVTARETGQPTGWGLVGAPRAASWAAW